MTNQLIKRVLENKTSKQLYIIIDKRCEIKKNDYVKIDKI
jgi:hypothetical protein